MRAYGAKRTYGECRTRMFKQSGKIHVRVTIKNHKRERSIGVV